MSEPPMAQSPESRSVFVFWPLSTLYVVLRPVRFFRRGVRHMSFGNAVLTVVLNVVAAMTVIVFYGSDVARMPIFERTVYLTQLGVMTVLWTAFTFVGAVLHGPAMCGVATHGQAFRRAMRVMAGTSALHPLVVFAMAMVVDHRRAVLEGVEARAGDGVAWGVYALLTAAPVIWCFVWLMLGLALDRAGDGGGARACGERRCENCGYDLRVVPEEQACSECGCPVERSFDPGWRHLPATEDAWGKRSMAAVLGALWSAFVAPRRFWSRTRVRCDSRRARNVFLLALVSVCVGSTLTASVVLAVFFAVMGQVDLARDAAPFVAYAIIFAVSLCAIILLGSQFDIHLAEGIARRRGNRLRYDELARIGYMTASLPAVVEAFAASFAVALLSVARWLEYFYGSWSGIPGRFTMPALAWAAAVLCGLIAAGAGVWSVVSMVRAHEEARYANY